MMVLSRTIGNPADYSQAPRNINMADTQKMIGQSLKAKKATLKMVLRIHLNLSKLALASGVWFNSNCSSSQGKSEHSMQE